MKTRYQHGFTLIELMITVMIAGIVLAFGVPSLTTFLQNDRLSTTTNTLVLDMMAARSKAVELNHPVSLCASSNQSSCNSSDFTDGWIIIADTDADGAVDTVTKVQDPITSGVKFKLSDTSLKSIDFDSRGFAPDNTGNITIYDSRGDTDSSARTLSISKTGRVRRK